MISGLKYISFQSKKMLDALFVGNFISAFQGKGIEFYDFREYHYGDDAKLIDWAVSSREGKTIVRRYIQERDMNVLFLIDENEQISFSPVKEKLKEELVFLFGNAALVSGASVGSLRMFQDEIEYIAPQKQEFVLYKMLQKSSKKERNTEILDIPGAFFQKQKRSLLCILSSSLSPNVTPLRSIALRHDVVYFHLSEHFENTLEGTGIRELHDTQGSYFIDLDDIEKKKLYVKARQQQYNEFTSECRKIGIDTVFLDEKKSLLSELILLMKERENISLRH